MPDDYTALVTALKALTQGEEPNVITLPMAENEWTTRPDVESYGIVSLDYEVDALHGDNRKQISSYEGAVSLFSRSKDGSGWVQKITDTLTEHCEGCWSLNAHMYEQANRIFHWEWVFQVEG